MSTRYPYVCRHHIFQQHHIDPELQHFQDFLAGDLFNVQISVHVKFVPYLPDSELPVLTPFRPFFSSVVATHQDLLGECPRFLRTRLPPLVRHLCLQYLALQVTSLAEQIVADRCHDSDKVARLLPLTIEVDLDFLYGEGDWDNIVNWIVQRHLQEEQVRMVPASDDAIASSLKEVKLQGTSTESEQCSICLENFEDNDDVSEMPCEHVFHQECIVHWLQTSHVCPLCRYKLPVEE